MKSFTKLRAIFTTIFFLMFSTPSIEAAKVKPIIMRTGLLSTSLSIGMGYLTGKILYGANCRADIGILSVLITTCTSYLLLRWYENCNIPENVLNKKWLNNNDRELIEIASFYQNPETLVMKIARKYLNKEEYFLMAVDAMTKLHGKLTRRKEMLTHACLLCDLHDEEDQELYKQIKEQIPKIEKMINDLTEAIVIIKITPEWGLEINRKNMKIAIAWASVPHF